MDLLEAHRILMAGLIDEAGVYRRGGVRVMAGTQVIHVAPPAKRVPLLMSELFRWLAATDAHPLVVSSVFHYEPKRLFTVLCGRSSGRARSSGSVAVGLWCPRFDRLVAAEGR